MESLAFSLDCYYISSFNISSASDLTSEYVAIYYDTIDQPSITPAARSSLVALNSSTKNPPLISQYRRVRQVSFLLMSFSF